MELIRHTIAPEDIGLKTSNLTLKSITRVRKGRGFSYVDKSGNALSGEGRKRVERLAIPPAWENVWISETEISHILAYGDDAAGRRQYIYHPDWRAQCEKAKFIDLPHFALRLPRLRRRVKEDIIGCHQQRQFAIATVVKLLDRGALRIGNWSSPTHGAVSLTRQHISFEDDQLQLSYIGKGGAEREIEIDDPYIISAINDLLQMDGKNIFVLQDMKIRPDDVNAYIRETMGAAFSAKDFRTWGGSVAATKAMLKHGASTIKDVSKAAADFLGNTPTIARSSYIHPSIIRTLGRGCEPKMGGPVRLRKYERLCFSLIENYSDSALSSG